MISEKGRGTIIVHNMKTVKVVAAVICDSLLEAEDARWLSKDTLYGVQWLPADITIIEKIEKQMKETKE